MTKLEELIQELCPDGVEFKPIKEVYQRLKGTPITAAKMKEIERADGDVRIFAGGKTVIDAYEEDIPKANITRVPAVLVQSRGVIDAVYYERPFTFKNEMWAYTHENKTAVKFLYYVLKNNMGKFREAASGMGSLPQISLKVTEDFEMPVPPAEVQSEIVRILDNFTELIAELIAELTARQKQYNYYRNKLLTFNGADIPIVQLRTVVKKSCSGSTPTKGNSGYYENGTIPWIRTQDVHFNEITEVDSYITEKAVAETAVKWIPENCVIVAISGATAGRCAINKIKATTNQHCLNLEIDESKALHRYIYYCIYNKYDELISRKQGARGDLNSSLVLSLEIPVPALDVQKRLVYVLDNFDAICSDLKIGLPAEIEARQNQYEFYRDALLTYAATGKTVLTDRQTDKLNGLIVLCQYVFGAVYVSLNMISENHDSKRKPITSGNREAGEYPYYGASGIVDYVNGYIFDGDYLLVSEDGNNLVARSTPIAFSISGKNWVNNHAHVLKFDCYTTRRYVEFYLNSIDLSQFISGGAQPKLNQKNLNTIPIPLPAIKEQEHIAGILDRFDALCNDISFGLPAEIEARTKQYEYYRDKLLSFRGENI